jgi:hypothetical protein
MAIDDMSAKLKTFAQILKFGHDLFDARGLQAAAAIAVNDSRVLLNFRNAALFERTSGKKAILLGQFAQIEPHPHAASMQYWQQLAETAPFGEDNTCIQSSDTAAGTLFFCCKLPVPAGIGEEPFAFIWILEYEKEIPPHVPNTAKLMGKSVAEALTLAKFSQHNQWKTSQKFKKIVYCILAVLLLAGLLFIKVPEAGTAEFLLKSQNITAAYAWFDGPIAHCFKQDGDTVRKGEVIIRYDVAQQQYKHASAVAALREAEANLQLELQNSFTDEKKLGKTKLLKARCETLSVAVNEAEWFLKHAEIKAPADGVLALSGGRAELLEGKAVRTGDKLFEVFDTTGMIAEILVNERDASILQQPFSVELFLHTAPEKAIPAEILETAHYPELTEQKTYCYPVRVRIPETETLPLRFGMRGVAKLSGTPIPLGYYLFKSVILYFRNW